MTNSRRKGKDGELEFAKLCREEGYEARRGQQYNGLEGQDVVGLPYSLIEVKRRNKLNLHDAVRQAKRDAEAQGKELAIVAHRKDGEGWLVSMTAEDFFKVFREFTSGKYLEEREREGSG